MLSFIAKRTLLALSQMLVISAVAFFLLYLSSSGIARTILGEQATEEQVAAKTAELGLDRPLPVRYVEWLLGVFQGDLGRSYFTPQDVSDALISRLPTTLSLLIATTIVAALIAFALGIAAAVYRGWLDRLVQILSIAGYAIPGFLFALLLVIVFAINLGWLPATGYVQLTADPLGWLKTVILPIAALSIGMIAATAQQVRGAVIDVLRQDYVRTLRSRGLSEREIIFKHVLRNASGTGLTVLGLQFVGLLGGAIVVEQIFALPGLGTVAIQYTSRGDIPVVMGLLIITSLIVAVVNLLVDLGVGFLNPKARVA
ncbi:ABC transporter permease [Agreia sp. Leaf244]|uniref:ABC transporter permease n=1 Tax=unclassified Agreia TaxID=2641148 RepID=UPI0006F52288|nr:MULTISPECIES: ABC transporter permease [unclassified Agreia]KQO10296.1 ABC transporter permease [Agreia sp. Leaf244]KQP57241.1 ABC transporter permease [Agreia sp. Leaf283]